MSDRFSAFRHVSYQRYFAARFFSSFAAQILSFSVAWQIYAETKSAFLLGMIGLVQFAPAVILVVFTGIASDRLGRRFVMGCAILLELMCAIAILFLAVTGQFKPLWVLTALTVFGVARAFYSPASASLAVNVVPQKDFANAVGWSASSWQMASVAGPAVGGLLYGISGLVAFSTSCIAFAIAAVFVFIIPKPSQTIHKEPTTWRTLVGGFTYVWKEKMVLGAISLDLFAVLLGGAVALLPIYAYDILDVGPFGLGLLRAAPGIGALLMLAVITVFPIKQNAGVLLFISVALFGAFTTVFGFSTIAWVSIAALILVGGFDMVSVYIREVILQLWTPDHVRGRVNAVNSIFLGASNELGEFRAGMMAAVYGAVFTVGAGGAAAVGIAALWATVFPGLRKVDSLEHTLDET